MLTKVVGSRRYYVRRASIHIHGQFPDATFEKRVCVFYNVAPCLWAVGFVFPAGVK